MPCSSRHPACASARPCPGRSSQGLAALRGLHLDRTCALAVTWQLTKQDTRARSAQSECPRFQGNPARLIVDLDVTRPPHDDLRVPSTELEEPRRCPWRSV